MRRASGISSARPRPSCRNARAIADARGGQVVRDRLEAKPCVGPDRVETFTRLVRRLSHTRRPLDAPPLERQVGRLFERNQRAAGRYVMESVRDPTRPAGLRLH